MMHAQHYYLQHGPLNSPGKAASVLPELPRDIAALCASVQGLLIHRDIAPWLYDLKLSSEERDIANTRAVEAMVTQIRTRNPQPLQHARAPRERMPGVCWHFASLTAAILREQGVPARARCGFGAYFTPGHFEDHWVAEYWNAAECRWVLVDAQLDSVQRKTWRIDFDPTDVPRDQFILAGDAWQQCRAGRADPELFGLTHIHEQGLWWIAMNLVRDLAALNRLEMLPWDVWGVMPYPIHTLADQNAALLDRVAALTLSNDAGDSEANGALRDVYADSRLRMPGKVFNADRKIGEDVPV